MGDENDDELNRSEPLRLAQVLSVDPANAEQLGDDELAAVLRHQLDTPIALDLGDAPDTSDPTTYGALLAAAKPSLELLQRVKQFTKTCKSQPDGPLPVEVATVLYFASIAKAQAALNTRISALSQAQVAEGVTWSLEQAWIPQPLRELLTSAQ